MENRATIALGASVLCFTYPATPGRWNSAGLVFAYIARPIQVKFGGMAIELWSQVSVFSSLVFIIGAGIVEILTSSPGLLKPGFSYE